MTNQTRQFSMIAMSRFTNSPPESSKSCCERPQAVLLLFIIFFTSAKRISLWPKCLVLKTNQDMTKHTAIHLDAWYWISLLRSVRGFKILDFLLGYVIILGRIAATTSLSSSLLQRRPAAATPATANPKHRCRCAHLTCFSAPDCCCFVARLR